jgi:hypothetical protein
VTRFEAVKAELKQIAEDAAKAEERAKVLRAEARRLKGVDPERSGTWTCGDGRTLNVAEMSNDHLANAIRWLGRMADGLNTSLKTRREQLRRLSREAKLRKLTIDLNAEEAPLTNYDAIRYVRIGDRWVDTTTGRTVPVSPALMLKAGSPGPRRQDY